jgi:HSP20 family protein
MRAESPPRGGDHTQEVIVMALVRTDPFRDVDRLFQQLWGAQNGGGRTMAMPMDAYRKADSFLIRVDLPGVKSESVDLTVEENVLTIKAERTPPPVSDEIESVVSERPYGTFVRQVFLGTNLDTEHIRAEYEAGVLTLVIPVAEHAKPRRIEVTSKEEHQELSA